VHQLEMAIYCRQLSQQSEGCRTTFKPHSEFLLVPEVLELPCRAAAVTLFSVGIWMRFSDMIHFTG
jgi:hypothetical protein